MKYFKNTNSILIGILIIAAILRFWRLDVNPPHLSPDEAALGYNAYSILKTGRDEYGQILPIIFKSFGDYKPGFYIYLSVPFVATLGLNEWSVRLPSAIAGVLGVLLLYLIIRNIRVGKLLEISDSKLEILAPAFLAISPWHIHLSRGAWEVNIALTLTLLGILFFLKSLINPKYLYFCSVFFSLSLITYQGAKLSIALILPILFVVFYKDVIKLFRINLIILLSAICIGTFISFPAIQSFANGQTGRLEVFSVFSYPRPTEYLQKFLDNAGESKNDLKYYLYHSEALNYVRGILGRYFNHFSGRFLFFEGDYQNPKHSSPNHGMLMLFDIVFLPIGIASLFQLRGRFKYFVLLWLILAPLPAVLTRDQVQAVRAYNMVIPLIIISSFGALSLNSFVKKFRVVGSKPIGSYLHTTINMLLSAFFICSFLYFLDSYFIHLPIHNAKYWSYGYKQVIEKLVTLENKYENVYFQQSYDQPYIYYLFYTKYDPVKYQKQANLSYYLGPDVGLVENLDKIVFGQWSWPYATGERSTLIIGNSVAIPGDYNKKDYNLVNEIKFPDNFMTAYRIVETQLHD